MDRDALAEKIARGLWPILHGKRTPPDDLSGPCAPGSPMGIVLSAAEAALAAAEDQIRADEREVCAADIRQVARRFRERRPMDALTVDMADVMDEMAAHLLRTPEEAAAAIRARSSTAHPPATQGETR